MMCFMEFLLKKIEVQCMSVAVNCPNMKNRSFNPFIRKIIAMFTECFVLNENFLN